MTAAQQPSPTGRSDADNVEQHACPKCDAQPGSPCRSRSGAVASAYHTRRFTQVPRLENARRVPIPAGRGPGRPWRPGTPPPAPVGPDLPSADIRIGYAGSSPVGQELDSQLDALSRHGIPDDSIFSERVSTRVRVRPRFEEALRTAREAKARAPRCRVILTVCEMKRLGRDAAELTALADHLTAHGLVLEMLAGPLPGIYDPAGPGKLLFAFFAAMAETERESIRESALEVLGTASREGKHGGRPPVITDVMLDTVLRRRATGESVEQIQPDLVILTGRRKGQNPSVASIYRALAEHARRETYPEAVEAAHADFAGLQAADSIPRPHRVRIRRPDDPVAPEEDALRERLHVRPRPDTGILSGQTRAELPPPLSAAARPTEPAVMDAAPETELLEAETGPGPLGFSSPESRIRQMVRAYYEGTHRELPYTACPACRLTGPPGSISAVWRPDGTLDWASPPEIRCAFCSSHHRPAGASSPDRSTACVRCGVTIPHPGSASLIECPCCHLRATGPAEADPDLHQWRREVEGGTIRRLQDRVHAAKNRSPRLAARLAGPVRAESTRLDGQSAERPAVEDHGH